MNVARIAVFSVLLTLASAVAPMRALAGEKEGFSTVTVKMGGVVIASYGNAHTDAQWVRAWKSEGSRALRNVKLAAAQPDGSIGTTTNYLACELDSIDLKAATLVIDCQGSEVSVAER